MNKEVFTFRGEDSTKLNAIVWRPEGTIRAILQITHGMTEHMDRYNAFAQAMTAQGILVAGFDLRGHGQNPGSLECASMGKNGWEASLKDMHLFFLHLQAQFPGLPHYMLGFSLGSFLLREYLGIYPEAPAGAIIAGTGQQSGLLLSIMMGIVKGEIKKAGFDMTTDLVNRLSFGVYNDKFKPTSTKADWLCSDKIQRKAYLSDKLCRKNISSGLFYQLLGSMKRTGKAVSYSNWNKNMPVLLLSGDADPVGDMGKGIKLLNSTMRTGGMQNVKGILLPGARHDIFHEVSSGAAESSVNLILEWMALRTD